MKCKDLTGETLGCMYIIKRDGNIGAASAWICRCSCGNELRKKGVDLRSIKYKVCSCDKSHPYRYDLNGMVFGKLTVQEKHGKKNGRIMWKCRCDCGNDTIISTSDLVGLRTKSCGCLIKNTNFRKLNLQGQKFGRLKVINTANNIGKSTAWECLCECGNTVIIKTGYLRNNTKSCGCLAKETSRINGRNNGHETRRNNTIKEMLGKKFNSLTIIGLSDKIKWTKRIWICLCDCGKQCEAFDSVLKEGRIKSCGCKSGEDKWKGVEDISGSYFSELKKSAARRKIDFSLSKEYLWSVFVKQNKKCALTGVDLFLSKNRHKYGLSTASVDRIDSDIGYVEGNVQFLHKYINLLKHSLSQENFINLCKLVVSHNDDNYVLADKDKIDINNYDVMKIRKNRKFSKNNKDVINEQ